MLAFQKSIVILLILALSGLSFEAPHTAHASTNPVNVIPNHSFEGGLHVEGVSGVDTTLPVDWDLETCEGVKSATVTVDSSIWTDGQNSTKVNTGPITPNGCFGPPVVQSATCSGFSQPSLVCAFSQPLNQTQNSPSIIAFCMGMSGTGNTFSVSDNQSNIFTIRQDVNTNTHIACGYSTKYTKSAGDNVTLTFQPNSLSDFGVVYEVREVAPVTDIGPCTGTGSGQSFGCDTQISVAAGPPFVFSMVASTSDMGTYSPGKNFFATNLAPTGNAEYSSSSLIAITNCPSSSTIPVNYDTVCVFLHNSLFANRSVGFSQFRAGLGSQTGYNITTLTDSPAAFSFWFQLQPYDASVGMAGFEVRLFGAEGLAELEYVFNPDPSVGQFSNSTNTHALLFYGYQYGRWYHFSRNLRADWLTPMGPANTPLNLNFNLTLVQFQGFSTKSGSIIRSETYWLDDVRLYQGAGTVPPESYFAFFSFTDINANIADSIVQWTLNNATGPIPYTLGGTTLAAGPYYVQVYYRAINSNSFILTQQIPLNRSVLIPLPLYPSSIVPSGYVALNNPATSLQINSPENTTTTISVQGPPGTSYVMVADVPAKPVLIQANGVSLAKDYEWKYDSTLSIARISFTMSPAGENITIVFQNPLLIPFLSFVDRTGSSVDSRVTFKILDSKGNRIPYSPGTALPRGTYYLEAYYAGFRVYRNSLSSLGCTNCAVILQMTPLDPARQKYLALNSTVTSITPSEFSDARISFSFTGQGPYLIIVNVPRRPAYVLENGVRTPNWVYNNATGTIAIDEAGQGSYQVVMDESSSLNYLYLAAGVIGVVAAASLGLYFWRKRRVSMVLATPKT